MEGCGSRCVSRHAPHVHPRFSSRKRVHAHTGGTLICVQRPPSYHFAARPPSVLQALPHGHLRLLVCVCELSVRCVCAVVHMRAGVRACVCVLCAAFVCCALLHALCTCVACVLHIRLPAQPPAMVTARAFNAFRTASFSINRATASIALQSARGTTPSGSASCHSAVPPSECRSSRRRRHATGRPMLLGATG